MAAKGGNFEIQDEKENCNFTVGQFQATHLWWAIVRYLKGNITLKRRRYKIGKQYDNCFTGENAVDVVYRCLCEEKKTHPIITNDITRTVATKVCQALLDNSIIEAVGIKTNHCIFEDRSTKFYQFSQQLSDDPQSINVHKAVKKSSPDKDVNNSRECKGVKQGYERPSSNAPINSKQSTSSSSSSSSLENSKSWFNCASPFQNANSSYYEDTSPNSSSRSASTSNIIHEIDKVIGSDSSQSLSTLAELKKPRGRRRTRSAILSRQRLPSSSLDEKENDDRIMPWIPKEENKPDAIYSPSTPNRKHVRRCRTKTDDHHIQMTNEKSTGYVDGDKIWKHVALSHLLTVLDLPFLEDVLQSPKKSLRKSDYQSVIPNPAVVGKSDSSLQNENLWIQTAQLITESKCFFLDNPIGLTDTQLKLQAFEKICRYYQSLPSPIIPANLIKIFILILGLIKQGSYSTATHALRLATLLLPWQQRKELKHLLKFMQLTADDNTVQLNSKVSNRQHVTRHFTPIILHYELLAINQAVILTSFMLYNHELILTPPPDIQLQVQRLYCESTFQEVISNPAITYCCPVRASSYEEQLKTTSYHALQELMNSVLDSTNLTLKDKERWMKKFKKHHPNIYTHCYEGDI